MRNPVLMILELRRRDEGMVAPPDVQNKPDAEA
jgi:hypothetical protein